MTCHSLSHAGSSLTSHLHILPPEIHRSGHFLLDRERARFWYPNRPKLGVRGFATEWISPCKRRYRREGFSADGKSPSRSGIPQGCCRGIPRKHPLHHKPLGSGGLDARPSATSAVAETGGLGWRASGQHPLRHTMAGCLDCRCTSSRILRIRRAPVTAGRGFSFMRDFIFWPTATKTATRPK